MMQVKWLMQAVVAKIVLCGSRFCTSIDHRTMMRLSIPNSQEMNVVRQTKVEKLVDASCSD